MISSMSWKEKTSNQKYSTQFRLSFKTEGKIKMFPDKQKSSPLNWF